MRGRPPKPRQDRGQPRAITPQLAALIERLKRQNPHRTGTTLLPELALSSGKDHSPLPASTLYRFLKQRGLSERELLAPRCLRQAWQHGASPPGATSTTPRCTVRRN